MVGQKNNVNKIIEILVHITLAMLFLLTFLRVGSAIATVLCTLFVLLGYFWANKNSFLPEKSKIYIYALLGFFLSALISYIVGAGWELESEKNPNLPSFLDLDLPFKYLLLALLTFLFLKIDFRIHKKIIFFIVALSACLNGVIGIYQRVFLGIDRVYGHNGIIEFGDACGIMSMMLLVIFTFTTHKIRIFYFIALFLVFLACLLTGTRGSILSAICGGVFIIYLVFRYQKSLLKQVLLGCLAMVLAGFVIMLGSSKMDSKRVELVGSDLKAYQEGETNTSIGLRFEMWKEAIAMWQMAPIFGLTTAEIKQRHFEIMEKSHSRIERGNTRLDWMSKKHNQFLNALAKRGVIGLLAILFVWFAVAKNALFYLKNQKLIPYGMIILSILFFSIFPNSFVGEIWESHVSIFILGMCIMLFIKLAEQEKKGEA